MLAFYYVFITFFLGVSLLLSLVILIQESKSMGLGASFGGDGGHSLFGTSTPMVLKKFTMYLAILFFVSCLVLSLWGEAISTKETLSPIMIEAGAS